MTDDAPDSFEPFFQAEIEFNRADPDFEKYVQLLETALRAGDDLAAYAVGSMYLHGPPVDEIQWPRDKKRGIALLRQASRSVHMAMAELASIYEAGEHGVRRSEKKAFEYFRRAVEFGSVCGRYHLGRCYYYGVGTPVNKRRATKLFREAAALGFPVYATGTSAEQAD